MKKFDGYDEVQVNNFPERLKLGGHICKVLEAKIEQKTSQKDGKQFEMLAIKFDIESPDEQAGFYNRKFNEDAKVNALKAKWRGVHRITVPTNESEDYIKSRFKAFTTSVEESNPGYKWNWEENTLVGKVFGGVFGYEEFTALDGNTITSTKIRYIKSIDKINEVEIPKIKLVDNTLISYEDYIAKKKAEKEANNNSNNNDTSEGTLGDDLPF